MSILERVGGIEPPSSAWKADIKAIIRYPPSFRGFEISAGKPARRRFDMLSGTRLGSLVRKTKNK